MEDAHCVELSLEKDSEAAYFAVFDGHGGKNFALYCSEHLHGALKRDKHYSKGDYRSALKETFLSLDKRLQDDPSLNFQFEPGGTTAVAVLVKDNTLFCANVGDSRAIASVSGTVLELSHDHKPLALAEERRIYKAGGWVEFNRVNGNLALSRAIGDYNFKHNTDLPQEQQIITAEPDVISEQVTPELEFIVLACDGVWDVMSNHEVVAFVRKRIAEAMKPELICEALMDHCLAPDCRMGGIGCDNMTVVLVCCLHSDSYEHLSTKCMARRMSYGSATNSASSCKNGGVNKVTKSSSEVKITVVNSPVHGAFTSSTPPTSDLDHEILTQRTSKSVSSKGDIIGPVGVETEHCHTGYSNTSTCSELPPAIETTI